MLPSEVVCNTPDLGNRREVWSDTVIVGNRGAYPIYSGYSRIHDIGSLAHGRHTFNIGNDSYTFYGIITERRSNGDRRFIFLTIDSPFTDRVKSSIWLHWCSNHSSFEVSLAAGTEYSYGYVADEDYSSDWSIYNTRKVALSLPPNKDATGKP